MHIGRNALQRQFMRQVASDIVIGCHFSEGRDFLFANIFGVTTAGMENTARDGFTWIGRLST